MDRAGFFVRLAAFGTDAIALVAIGFGVEYFLWERIYFAAVDAGREERAEYMFVLVQYALMLLYTAFDVFFAGTPGKLLFRLRIANFDGTRPPPSRLILRWLTKYQALIYSTFTVLLDVPALEVLAGVTFYVVAIGCLYAMRDSRLTWHDEWAWTSVVWAGDARYRSPAAISIPPSVGAA